MLGSVEEHLGGNDVISTSRNLMIATLSGSIKMPVCMYQSHHIPKLKDSGKNLYSDPMDLELINNNMFGALFSFGGHSNMNRMIDKVQTMVTKDMNRHVMPYQFIMS